MVDAEWKALEDADAAAAQGPGAPGQSAETFNMVEALEAMARAVREATIPEQTEPDFGDFGDFGRFFMFRPPPRPDPDARTFCLSVSISLSPFSLTVCSISLIQTSRFTVLAFVSPNALPVAVDCGAAAMATHLAQYWEVDLCYVSRGRLKTR